MKSILDMIGTLLLTVILLIVLHAVAAMLNTTVANAIPGVVCYIWAYLMIHDKEDK